VGIDRDIVTASLSAITGALGRIEPVALPALSTEDTLPHVVTLAVR
jgi:hypothetical protein